MVGRELLATCPDRFIPLPCDVRNMDEIDTVVRKSKVDTILHLASISDVERCEREQKLVEDVNLHGTYNVLSVGDKYGCPVVFISSCQVFDGFFGGYKESNKPHPINYYGMSKFAGESLRTVFDNMKIIRTSYLFDFDRMGGDIHALRCDSTIYYPTFIHRSFMYLPHFVQSLCEYFDRLQEMPRILHISGTKSVSWYTFMKDTVSILGFNPSLVQARTKEDHSMTPRPKKAGLNVSLSARLKLPQFDYLHGLHKMASLL